MKFLIEINSKVERELYEPAGYIIEQKTKCQLPIKQIGMTFYVEVEENLIDIARIDDTGRFDTQNVYNNENPQKIMIESKCMYIKEGDIEGIMIYSDCLNQPMVINMNRALFFKDQSNFESRSTYPCYISNNGSIYTYRDFEKITSSKDEQQTLFQMAHGQKLDDIIEHYELEYETNCKIRS